MATTTTNFGWDIPQSTDLVKDGATAIAALGQDIDTAFVDLKGGTTGQVLAKASGTDLDFTWATDASGIPATIFDAKGDLIAASAADTAARLAVGTDGQVLTADSTAATGLKWAGASAATYVGCQVYLTSNLSLANNTGVIVSWTAENFDTDGFHDLSTNTSRLTVPAGKGGKYLVSAMGVYAANATGWRATALRLNGTTYMGESAASVCGSGTNQGTTVVAILNLSDGDYIEVDVSQTSGGSLNLASGTNQSKFSMSFLGA
jgi:hypothetical protein